MVVMRIKAKSTNSIRRAMSAAVRRSSGARRAAEKPLIWPGVPVEISEDTILEKPDGVLEFTLPVRLTNDNNGQKRHWGRSARRRTELGLQIKAWFPLLKPIPFPVRVSVIRVLGKGDRLWDEDSIGRGNAKQLIDALRKAGMFVNDDPRWIVSVPYSQDSSDRREYPRVRIRIERALK